MSLRFGILGLLEYAPMSGYDLKGLFENSIRFFWSAETSQIYRELKILEKSNYVKSKIERSNSGPNRNVFFITPAGAKALKKWLLESDKESLEDNRNEFLLRVFLSSNVGEQELLKQLEIRLEKYKRDLEALQNIGKVMEKFSSQFDSTKVRLFWEISASRGIHDVMSHIAWAEESIALLKSKGFTSEKVKK